ncbi:MAG: hypothetical protein NAG76_18255 [Candidatus Pristimantibacillus lignocellulolyticus]|uniref:Uncharacterized protein n=1 Tax=Candidatus Pristimantibacillus lignocellulolyticus TaxID=2994561 RepID=A0A9J6ZCJ2_9BACL|nr:MAG: hypothetical protein NAG76_18255 [Candidatus Pristimantibacillus lignocellulolyticus]
MNWESALETFCELYHHSSVNCDWIIVGSVSSVLQGAKMIPNDIDIYVRNKEDVSKLAFLLSPYSIITKSELSYYDSEWLSSIEEPYYTQTFPSGFSWTKGKWMINGFNVEVVHISDSAGIADSDKGEGIWEGGKYIWSLAKQVEFGDYSIPIIPLEIQLESNLRRDRPDRVESIINAMKTNGYSKELLTKALSINNYVGVKELLM